MSDPSRIKYQTLDHSLDANGMRHLRRAFVHWQCGFPDYARGSLRKAAKNFIRAHQMKSVFANVPTVEALTAKLENKLRETITGDILRG